MINLPPIQTSKAITAKTIPAIIRAWQVGQIVEAKALSSSNAKGELQVQIDKLIIDAKSKHPILAGEDLKLRIDKLGEEPLLKIMNNAVKADPITLYLRQAVPQPNSLKLAFNLINHLQQAISSLDLRTYPAVKSISQQIDQLLQLPIRSEKIVGNEIQQFLNKSGFNLENQILNKQIPSQNLKLELIQTKHSIEQFVKMLSNSTGEQKLKIDNVSQLISLNRPAELAQLLLGSLSGSDKSSLIKVLNGQTEFLSVLNKNLLPVATLLQKLGPLQLAQVKQWMQIIPTIAEIRQLIEQSLNTITNQQLQAVQADADSAFLVIFNLLVAKNPDWIDLFNISVSKEQNDEDDDAQWRVIIQIDMPVLGVMEAKLTLVNNELHTGITAELAETHKTINQYISLLESALHNAGFNVATVSCRQAKVQAIAALQKTHGPLVDDIA